MRRITIALAIMAAWPLAALAGEADVVGVEVDKQDSGRFTFSVAVRHADTGWEHYSDKWDVVAPNGDVLATRVLVHPHVDEQPFTRSLSGVQVPEGMDTVIVRAHDSVHGYGGVEKRVTLP